MADKPSRALMLCGDGLARFIEPSHSYIHINSLASNACCGFLSLPNAPPSETEDERIVREFAQLLDACDDTKALISERFMGMRSAIITNNSSLKSFCGKVGLTVMHINEIIRINHSLAQSPVPVDAVACELLKLLGFEQGKALEESQFDIVFVHIGAGEKVNGENDNATADDMESINDLIGNIMLIAQPGSEIGSRLHLSLVMSYGSISDNDDPKFSVLTIRSETSPDLSFLFPRQSYTMKGEISRNNVRHHCPMLISQWQYAVTRKDMVNTFTFEDFKEHGGNLVIPADRYLHEVAFKLWKAPKYGA
ncbi:hypothetical protein CFOL_v3_12608 [Cephalotus follicularis]|uniref:Uncharacterized protein n=1 Tax=Cephalotus follicularis TaxID=3775 RepID=A0A1Q3BM52_CEPFO|nr:hypothetical protein CFOL_v3_12608 [Cephalotus follicularis]